MRDHALSLFFLAIFLLALAGQAVVGLTGENEERAQHGSPPLGFGEYVTSSSFIVDVAENWQSEFLQFFLFILATVWLVQRGSPESKKPGDEGLGSDRDQLMGRWARADSPRGARARGLFRTLYSHSLLLVMGAVFALSWWVQSLAGTTVMNEENAQHGRPPVSWAEYVVSPDFWDRTLQNWQSEFLAVGTMVAFSIYLRERGSSESKPVGMPHGESAIESE